MSEKYKILRNAEKYVVSGKFSQAVKEYQKLLSKEPDEPTLLNTVGDLLLKQNSRAEALDHFRRAADVYQRNGFLVKAIAVLKKVYQFDPSEPRVNESLADLYQRQGLTYEAGRHLQVLIKQHEDNGNVEQASNCLQRLVELEPDNPELQAELAVILEKRHDEGGAFQRYQAAAELYLQRDDNEKALESAKKALEFDPTDDRTVELFVLASVKCEQRDHAKDVLVELVSKTGQRLPYEMFLARLMEEEGDFKGAHAKYLELEPLAFSDSRIREGISRTAPIAPVAESEDGKDAPIELIFDEPRSNLREVPPSGRADWLQLNETHGGFSSPAGTPDGFDVRKGQFGSAPTPAFQSPPIDKAPADFLWQAPEAATPAEEEEEEVFEPVEGEQPFVEETPIESLDEALQEADFYLKLGFREEAKKLLERLLHSYPRDERVRRRAEKVMTIPPEFDVAAEPVELFPAEAAEEKPAKAKPAAQPKPAPPPPPPAAAAVPLAGEEVPFDLASFEQSLQDATTPTPLFGEAAAPEEAKPAAPIFELGAEATEEPIFELEEPEQQPADMTTAAEPEGAEVLDGQVDDIFTLDLSETEEAADIFETFEEKEEAVPEPTPPPAPPPAPPSAQPKPKSAFLARLAELEQQMTEAEASKQAPEAPAEPPTAPPVAAPPPPAPTPVKAKPEAAPAPPPAAPAPVKAKPEAAPAPPPVAPAPVKAKPEAAPPPPPAAPVPVQAKAEAAPAPPPVAPAPVKPVAEPASAAPLDMIPVEELDEAPTVKEEITEPEFDDEVDSALDTLFSGDALDEAPAVEEVLRYDVAATSAADETSNPKVHYDLGLAYKEMGLIEDAVQEFQTAVHLLNNPMYNPQRILCCSMLANSLLQLGRYPEANRWAEEGLKIPGKKEFEWKALKYDWASALERQAKYGEALDGFREILDRDPEYRDVIQRIDNLMRLNAQ